MQARGRVPVRAVPGAGAGRCRVFARKAKKIGTKNLLSFGHEIRCHKQYSWQYCTWKWHQDNKHTLSADFEHLPPDFTVKSHQNFRRVPSNKDQIKY
jgi:hypothetical protein